MTAVSDASEDDWIRESWDPREQASIQQRSDFWGWYIAGPSSTQPLTCLSTTELYVTSGKFGGCCRTIPCPLPTACGGNFLHLNNGRSTTCGDVACHTISVFGDDATPTMNFICRGIWPATEMWRRLPAETTSSHDTATYSSASPSVTSETSPSSTSSQPGESNITSGNDDGGGSRMVWIAGAVVGSIVLILALFLGIWWYRRRAAKKAVSSQPPLHQEHTPALAQHPGWTPSPSHTQAKPPYYREEGYQPSSWPDNRYSAVEVPSSPSHMAPQELPSSPQRA